MLSIAEIRSAARRECAVDDVKEHLKNSVSREIKAVKPKETVQQARLALLDKKGSGSVNIYSKPQTLPPLGR